MDSALLRKGGMVGERSHSGEGLAEAGLERWEVTLPA